jgi:hypothetical protein
MTAGLKMCTRCLRWKPAGVFYHDNHRADGLTSWCPECCSEKQADYRERFAQNPTHHGYGAYTQGCRCPECKDAKAAYMRERRSTAYLAATPEPVPDVTHGTRSAYEERGCRCPECKAAQEYCSRHPRRESAA